MSQHFTPTRLAQLSHIDGNYHSVVVDAEEKGNFPTAMTRIKNYFLDKGRFMGSTTPCPKICRIIAAISSVLGHGCAVPIDQVETQGITTLRTIDLAMRLNSAIYNDGVKQDGNGWMCGIASWNANRDSLSWETGTGRLRVVASAPEGERGQITLIFSSGELTSHENAIDRHVFAEIYCIEGSNWSGSYVWEPHLEGENMNRLGLLLDIDKKLNGEIGRDLKESATKINKSLVAVLDRLSAASEAYKTSCAE
jgi:hypothetical protein